jgi:E3 SUMO-protein ligase PIAS1
MTFSFYPLYALQYFLQSASQRILPKIHTLTSEIGIQSLAESDPVSFDALARRIRATAFPNTVPYQSPTRPQYQPSPVSQSPAQARSAPLGVSMSPHPYSSGPSAPLMKPPVTAHKSSGPLIFKESPFYTILEPLTPIVECKGTLLYTFEAC